MAMQSQFSVRDVLTVVFKHRGKMLLTCAVTVASVAAATFTQTPIYESSSTVLIRFGRHFVYRLEAGRDGRGGFEAAGRASVINADIDILTSQDLLREVVETVGLEKLYPGAKRTPDGKLPSAVLRRMADAYRVRGMDESNTLRVSFEHPDPQVAAQTVNTAVSLFSQKHIEAFGNPGMVPFYEEKVNFYRGRLGDLDGHIRDYQLAESTVSLEEQRTLLLRELNQLDSDISRTETRVAGTRRRVESLTEQLASHQEHAALSEESEVRGVEEQLLQLKIKEKELRSQFKETERQVVNVRQQIALVEAFLADAERVKTRRIYGRSEAFDSIEVALATARAELAELSATLPPARQRRAELAVQLATLPARQLRLRELERERKLAETTYENYQTRLSDARITADMDREQMADVSVLQHAHPADKPVRPDRQTALIIGLVVGICLAFAVAFGYEFLSTTWDAPARAADDLEMPVLGTVRYREGFGL